MCIYFNFICLVLFFVVDVVVLIFNYLFCVVNLCVRFCHEVHGDHNPVITICAVKVFPIYSGSFSARFLFGLCFVFKGWCFSLYVVLFIYFLWLV